MLCLQLFGGVTLLSDDAPVTGTATQRRRLALLARIAAAPNGSVSRDKLIACFWPDEDRERARHHLADSVFTLRKALGKELILTTGDDLILNPDLLQCDLWQFHAALRAGELERACTLYRGPFLDGFFVADAPEVERWVEEERDRLARLYGEALERLAEEAGSQGDHARSVQLWRRLAAQDPFSSRVALRLMQALAASGDRATALQHAKVHAVLLREELDVAPDPEVEAFAVSLAEMPAPSPRPAAPPVSPPTPSAEDSSPPPTPPPPTPRPGDEAIAPLASPPHAIPDSRRAPPARRRRLRARLLHPRRFGLVLGGLLVLVLIASVAAIWRNARLSGSFTMPWADGGRSDVTSIAVMPFDYQGPPESELAHLDEGLVYLLSTSLNGAGGFRSIDPYVTLSQASERGRGVRLRPDLASGIAASLGADLFSLGAVTVAGATIRITVSLYSSGLRPEVVASESVEGTDPVVLVDSLTRLLLVGQLDLPADRLARSAVFATSLDALKAFLQGEHEFRAARYQQAAAALREAVRLDPEFAQAHYRLSAAAAWSFRFEESVRAADEAWRLSGDLPRREQLLIAAWRDFVTGHPNEAENVYDALLAEDDIDVEAWSGLGEVRAHYNALRGKETAEAVAAFDEVLRLAPNYGEARFHRLELRAREGDVAAVDSLLKGVDPASPQLLSWQAARAAWGAGVLPDSLMPRLREAQGDIVGVAAVRTAVHFQEITAAQELARLLTLSGRPVGWQAAGHLMIAQGFLARGEWEAARAAIDSSMAVEPAWSLEILGLGALLPQSGVDDAELRDVKRLLDQWDPRELNPDLTFFFGTHALVHAELRSYLLALLSLRLGDDEAADGYAGEIAVPASGRSGTLGPALRLSYAAHRAFLRDGDPERALQLLDDIQLNAPVGQVSLSPFYAQSLDRYLRAEAARALNQPEEALRWYRSLSDGADLLFWLPAHEHQRELHAQLGNASEAEHHAERARSIRAGISGLAGR